MRLRFFLPEWPLQVSFERTRSTEVSLPRRVCAEPKARMPRKTDMGAAVLSAFAGRGENGILLKQNAMISQGNIKTFQAPLEVLEYMYVPRVNPALVQIKVK